MKQRYGIVLFNIFMLFLSIELDAQSGWFSQNSGTAEDLHAVRFINAETGFTVGKSGTILKTIDGGTNWLNIKSDFSFDFNSVHFFDADSGIIVGNSDIILRSTDGGINWSTVTGASNNYLNEISFYDDVGICSGSLLTILNSSDRGRSWNVVQSGLLGGPFNGAHMINASTGIVVGQNAIFQPLMGKTTDGGSNWSYNSFLINNQGGELFDVYFLDENVGFAVARLTNGLGGLSRTEDGGTSWTTMIFNHGLYGIDFPTENVAYAVGFSGTILKTDDSGRTCVQCQLLCSINDNYYSRKIP